MSGRVAPSEGSGGRLGARRRNRKARRSRPPAAPLTRGPAVSSATSRADDRVWLFAYGTLMAGYRLHAELGDDAERFGRGAVAGELLDLGSYPGLVPGPGTVSGEVYQVASGRLPHLDRVEGYTFERRPTPVAREVAELRAVDGGSRITAWVYWYRGPRGGAVPIPSGDYRRERPPTGSARATRRQR